MFVTVGFNTGQPDVDSYSEEFQEVVNPFVPKDRAG
jgi:hypothetical protein